MEMAALKKEPTDDIIDPEFAEKRAIISKTLNRHYVCDRLFGNNLLRPSQPGESAGYVHFRRAVFALICILFCVGIAVCVILCCPAKNDVAWTMDVYFVYPFLLAALTSESLASFIAFNVIAARSFSSEKRFMSGLLEPHMLVHVPVEACKRWNRINNRVLILIILSIFGDLTVAAMMFAGAMEPPVIMARFASWTGLPEWLGWSLFGATLLFGPTHTAYQVTYMDTHCELVRLHFKAYNERMKNEEAAAFNSRRILGYQHDYFRLTELVQRLDKAYRYSCFLHVAGITIASCLMLHISVEQEIPEGPLFFIGYFLIDLVFLVLFTAIPSILLDAEVSCLPADSFLM